MTEIDTRKKELEDHIRTTRTVFEDIEDDIEFLIRAAYRLGVSNTLETVQKNITVRYYPEGFHGDTLEPIQCIPHKLEGLRMEP
jgi:hypothetical protein